jgi:hypothetical protein
MIEQCPFKYVDTYVTASIKQNKTKQKYIVYLTKIKVMYINVVVRALIHTLRELKK